MARTYIPDTDENGPFVRFTIRRCCNQNRRFGCGKMTELDARTLVIGVDRVRMNAGGSCSCCLPLAVHRDASPEEAEAHWAAVEAAKVA